MIGVFVIWVVKMDKAKELPQIKLTEIGKITEKYLLSSENIHGVKIDRYVIMPNHIHIIVFLNPDEYVGRTVGSSRAPTSTDTEQTSQSSP